MWNIENWLKLWEIQKVLEISNIAFLVSKNAGSLSRINTLTWTYFSQVENQISQKCWKLVKFSKFQNLLKSKMSALLCHKSLSGLERSIWCTIFFKRWKADLSDMIEFRSNSEKLKIVCNRKCKLPCVKWYRFPSQTITLFEFCFENWKTGFVKNCEISSNLWKFQNRLKSWMQASLWRIIFVSGLEQNFDVNIIFKLWKTGCVKNVESLLSFKSFEIFRNLKCKLPRVEWYGFPVWNDYFYVTICLKSWKTGFVTNRKILWKFKNFKIVPNLQCRLSWVEWYQFLFSKNYFDEKIFSRNSKTDLWRIEEFGRNSEHLKTVWNRKCKLPCAEWYWFLVLNNYFDVKIFSKTWKPDLSKMKRNINHTINSKRVDCFAPDSCTTLGQDASGVIPHRAYSKLEE